VELNHGQSRQNLGEGTRKQKPGVGRSTERRLTQAEFGSTRVSFFSSGKQRSSASTPTYLIVRKQVVHTSLLSAAINQSSSVRLFKVASMMLSKTDDSDDKSAEEATPQLPAPLNATSAANSVADLERRLREMETKPAAPLTVPPPAKAPAAAAGGAKNALLVRTVYLRESLGRRLSLT
jgi:hypothetical protein